MRILLHTTAILLATGQGAFAADDLVTQNIIPLDEVLLEASLSQIEAGRSGATVAVLTEADLQKAGQARLLDSLEQVAGFHLRSNGAIGAVAGFSLRGASQNYVKVLVDGIDVSDPSAPQVAAWLGGYGAGPIDRIEVIKGSQSAIHGPGAIGGVIAMTTPRATQEGQSQSLSLEVGSYNTKAATWGLTHKQGATEAALSLSHLRTDGFSSAAGPDNTEADGYHGSRLHLHLSHQFDSGLKLGLTGLRNQERVSQDLGYYYPLRLGEAFQYDAFYNAVVVREGQSVTLTPSLSDGLTPDEHSRNRMTALRAFAQFEALGWDHNLSATRMESRRFSYENDIVADWLTMSGQMVESRYHYAGTRETLNWTAQGALRSDLQAALGAAWEQESYAQASPQGPSAGKVRAQGIYGELQWSAHPDLDVSVALRRDRHSDFGGQWTGRVAMAWRFSPDWTLRAQGGTGYRAPSSYERYDPSYGNAALRPEESRSLDLGIEGRFAMGALRATAFWLQVDQLIDYDFSTNRYNQTEGASVRRGIEAEGTWQIATDLQAGLAYTWIDTAQSAAASWSIAPPKSTLNLSLGYEVTPALGAGVALRHVTGRAQDLPDYTTLNLQARYTLSQGQEVYARLENATDRSYQTVPGYNTSGRALYLGLRMAF